VEGGVSIQRPMPRQHNSSSKGQTGQDHGRACHPRSFLKADTRCLLRSPDPLAWMERTLLVDEVFGAAGLAGDLPPDATAGPSTEREGSSPTRRHVSPSPNSSQHSISRWPDAGVPTVGAVAAEGSEHHAGRPRSGRRLCGGAVGEWPIPVEWLRDSLGESVPPKPPFLTNPSRTPPAGRSLRWGGQGTSSDTPAH
jgi:hypothetical protein